MPVDLKRVELGVKEEDELRSAVTPTRLFAAMFELHLLVLRRMHFALLETPIQRIFNALCSEIINIDSRIHSMSRLSRAGCLITIYPWLAHC